MKRANGTGSIYKLGGKRRKPWAVRITAGWTPEGKQILKYLGTYTTKREANEALSRYIVEPYNIENTKMTLSQVYDLWLKSTKLAEATMKNYRTGYNKCKAIHSKVMKDIKVAHIEEILAENKPAGQKQIKSCLNQLYIYAEKNEIVSKNIAALVEVDQSEPTREKIPFTADQIRALLSYEDHHYADTPKILLYTGMRINELFGIKTENVNLEKRYMVGGNKTPSGKKRIIPIHEAIYPIIERWYNQGNEYLITTVRGKQVLYGNYHEKFWKPLQQEMGFTQTPHDARHTFITAAGLQGIDRTAIQKIVGHKGASITDHYTHRTKEELIDQINILEY
jgi:integrase